MVSVALSVVSKEVLGMQFLGSGTVKLPWALLLDMSDLSVARVLVKSLFVCNNLIQVSIFQDRGSGIEMRG